MQKKTTLLFLYSFLVFIICSCIRSHELTSDEQRYLNENDTIKVALYPYYPPYQFINENGEMDGIFIDYLTLLEKKLDYKFKRVYYTDWPKLVEDAKKQKIDFILEIQKSEGKGDFLHFLPPIFESRQVIVSRKDQENILEDLYKKSFILPEGYGLTENLIRIQPDLNYVTQKDDVACLELLNSGKHEVYIGPKALVHYLITNKNFTNLRIVSESNFTYQPGIAVVKKNKILQRIIEKAFSDISSGEKNTILENWLFNVVTPFYQTISFWILMTFLIAFLLLLIIAINRYLKFKIQQRTKELIIAKDKAEESNRLKTNFIQNISHEIRTPMNGIIGFSELLKNEELTDDERKNYTDTIISSGEELIVIIDNILEISKLQSEQITIRAVSTDLNDLLTSIYNIYKTKALGKNIDLELHNEMGSSPGTIRIDKSKLSTILNNLINNAVKFTESGKVTIKYHIENDSVIITIEDTGIGVKPEDQKVIFQSFSQSEKEISKNLGGLGLGLTIAKKNADLINGKLSFTSKEKKGSIFTLKIPYFPIKEPIDKKSIISREPDLNSEKHIVLIAEDGEVNFLFLKTVLTKMPDYDFVIYRAKNGQEAIDLCLEHENIDLVLMDIKMPIMDGYDATKYIKKIRPQLPVIAQTAYSTEEDIQKALEAGCDDFVSKPVDRKVLRPILKRYFSIFSK